MTHVEQRYPAPIPIPDWLPDESLFSLLSRIHQLSGHRFSWQTTQLLFGNRAIGYQHDFPGYLSELVQRLGLPLSHALELASRKTLLNYYRLFLSPDKERALALTMCHGQVAHLKMRLGIITSRFRANHPLKACPMCIRQDIAEFGWAYWHLNHQFPGVWLCLDHDQPLLTSILKSTGVGRFDWHLPSESTLTNWSEQSLADIHRNVAVIHSLADSAVQLILRADTIRFNHASLQRVYWTELRRRGWLTKAGSLKLSQISSSFQEYAIALRCIPEFSALPQTCDEAKAQIGRLLRKPKTGTHPIRHFTIINWLYPQLDAFWDDCYQVSLGGVNEDPVDTASRVGLAIYRQAQRQQLKDLIQNHQYSLSAAARYLNVDIGTVMMWAGKLGIPIKHRPKSITEDVRFTIIAKLRDGQDKQIIAQEMNLSVSSITRILLTETGLQTVWHKARHLRRRNQSRQQWLALVAWAASGVKIMRGINPALYAWLYRNDREWLSKHLPEKVSFFKRSSARLRWDQRDVLLSKQIEQVAMSLLMQNSRRNKLFLWQLYQQIPELKAKLSVLARLPLTNATIKKVLDAAPYNHEGELGVE